MTPSSPENAAPAIRRPAARLAGAAALAGGLCWVVKSAAILAGGAQPAYLLEAAPLLMALATAGLAVAARAGAFRALLSLTAVGAGAAAITAYLVMPDSVVWNAALLAATLLTLAALFAVGGRVRRAQTLRRWSGLPRRIAFWTVPLVLAGGLLSVWNERLLELPLLLLGLAWLWLGVVLLVQRPARPRGDAPAKPAPGAKDQGTRAARGRTPAPPRKPQPVSQPPRRSTTGARPGPRP